MARQSDKSGASKAAIAAINTGRDIPIVVRQVKYLNNIVEQEHRAIKARQQPVDMRFFGFKGFTGFTGFTCVEQGVSSLW